MKKFKFIAFILLIAMSLSMTSIAADPEPPKTWSDRTRVVIGDADGDDEVKISDVLEILKYLAGMKCAFSDDTTHYCKAVEPHDCPPIAPCANCATHKCPVDITYPDEVLGQPSGAIPDSAYRINLNGTTADIRTKEGGPVAQNIARFYEFNSQTEAGQPTGMPTVTIRRGGHYVLSGNFEGQIYITARADTPGPDGSRALEEVFLYLNGVNITAKSRNVSPENHGGPAINGRRSSSINIIIVDGTENTLTDTVNYTTLYKIDENGVIPPENRDAQPRATLYSRHDINIWGNGRLTVNGNHRDGIHSRDNIKINGGDITVNTLGKDPEVPQDLSTDPDFRTQQAGNAIQGRDALEINAGKFRISSSNHGLRSSNLSFVPEKDANGENKLDSDGNVIYTDQIRYDRGYITITGGAFKIDCLDGIGIRAETKQTITGGIFEIEDRQDRRTADDEDNDVDD